MTAKQKKKLNKILLTLQKAEARIMNLESELGRNDDGYSYVDAANDGARTKLYDACKSLREPVATIIEIQKIEYNER